MLMGFWNHLIMNHFDACEPCLMGKMTKTPFSGTMERATDILEIMHTDVCSLMSVEARGKYRYFSDLHRCFEQIWVYLLDET